MITDETVLQVIETIVKNIPLEWKYNKKQISYELYLHGIKIAGESLYDDTWYISLIDGVYLEGKDPKELKIEAENYVRAVLKVHMLNSYYKNDSI